MVVDRGDAGVVELCGGTDFVPKGRDEAGVGDDIGTQNLERDRMRVHRMVSLKDGGHPWPSTLPRVNGPMVEPSFMSSIFTDGEVMRTSKHVENGLADRHGC